MTYQTAAADHRAFRGRARPFAARILARLFSSIERSAARHRQIAALESLDDRLLRDVGLTREDVRRASRWMF